MNLLGIDYGRARVGLALSAGYFARPYKVISHPKDLPNIIKQIVETEKIDQIILGHPKGLLASEVANLANRLENELKISVELYDEDFTTVESEEILKSYGLHNIKKYPIDALAAAAILQGWIDNHKEKLG